MSRSLKSFESASYRIPSNIKLTFRTFTVFSPKTPKNLLSVHFSIYADQVRCRNRSQVQPEWLFPPYRDLPYEASAPGS